MSFAGRKVLVTGAGGFIGSHLAEALVEAGASVRSFVIYDSLGSSGWLDHSRRRGDMEIVAGDLADRDSVRSAMRGCDLVFHLGALIAIPYSYNAPASYVGVNVNGTLNVLQAARDLANVRVIHTSTSEVYGTAQYVPIDEKHPLQAQSPYAATKIAADKLAESFHLSFGLPVTTVRPFNTFGPRQSPRAVIPTIILQCLNGGEIRLGNLEPTRDFTYVTDTVSGFLCAAQADSAIGDTINLGTGREISIGDLVNLIGHVTNVNPRIVRDDQRVRRADSEVERLCADARRAQSSLNWKPQVTLEDGLRRAATWMSQNMDLHLSRYKPTDYAI
jgi:NAD dependent epimerase/dehydratase